jgi:S-(hydroxymethyl)glutathione dehydrogenase/alcohol dehydrogenase
VRGAVLRELGDEALEVRDDIELLSGPGPGQVLLEVKATGLCHSDLSGMNGTIPAPTPSILGHEAAGVVTEIGPGVPNVSEGDHVVVSLIPPCGTCNFCVGGQANLCDSVINPFQVPPAFRVGGEEVFPFGGIGSFTERVVLPHQAVIPIDDDVPFDIACLIGCGVLTGVGAVFNAAQLRPGGSAVVFGCGGVGMSVIQGARIAGAAEIVAVDRVESKFDQARAFGATHTVTPGQLTSVGDAIHGGLGFDYAFECVGMPQTIRDAFDATRRGGSVTIVGAGSFEAMVEFSAFELFYFERKMMGTVYGSSDVRRDCPKLLRLWRSGRLDLESMVSRRLGIDEINEGMRALAAGEVVRQVVEFS